MGKFISDAQMTEMEARRPRSSPRFMSDAQMAQKEKGPSGSDAPITDALSGAAGLIGNAFSKVDAATGGVPSKALELAGRPGSWVRRGIDAGQKEFSKTHLPFRAMGRGLLETGKSSLSLEGSSGAPSGQQLIDNAGLASTFDSEPGKEAITNAVVRGLLGPFGRPIAETLVPGDVRNLKNISGKIPGMALEAVADPVNLVTAEGAVNALSKLGKGVDRVSDAARMSAPIQKASQYLDDLEWLNPRGADNSEAVANAFKELTGKDAPGFLLTKDKTTQRLADTLRKSPTMGGAMVRTELDPLEEALKNYGKELSDAGTNLSPYETGKEVSKGIGQRFDEMTQPAREVYEGLETQFKDVPLDYLALKRGINKLRKEYSTDFTGEAQKLLDQIEKTALGSVDEAGQRVGGIKNVSELRDFRTKLGKFLSSNASDAQKDIVNQLYGVVTRERNRSVIKGGMKSSGKIGREARAEGLLGQLKGADRSYREAFENTTKSLGVEPTAKHGMRTQLRELLDETPPEQLAKQLFNKGDFDQISALKKNFPEQFEQLRANAMSDIIRRSTVNGELSLPKAKSNLEKLGPEVRSALLQDLTKKQETVNTILEALPPNFNPSDTSTRLEFLDLLRPDKQAMSMGSYGLLRAKTRGLLPAPPKEGILEKAGSAMVRGGEKLEAGAKDFFGGAKKFIKDEEGAFDPEALLKLLKPGTDNTYDLKKAREMVGEPKRGLLEPKGTPAAEFGPSPRFQESDADIIERLAQKVRSGSKLDDKEKRFLTDTWGKVRTVERWGDSPSGKPSHTTEQISEILDGHIGNVQKPAKPTATEGISDHKKMANWLRENTDIEAAGFEGDASEFSDYLDEATTYAEKEGSTILSDAIEKLYPGGMKGWRKTGGKQEPHGLVTSLDIEPSPGLLRDKPGEVKGFIKDPKAAYPARGIPLLKDGETVTLPNGKKVKIEGGYSHRDKKNGRVYWVHDLDGYYKDPKYGGPTQISERELFGDKYKDVFAKEDASLAADKEFMSSAKKKIYDFLKETASEQKPSADIVSLSVEGGPSSPKDPRFKRGKEWVDKPEGGATLKRGLIKTERKKTLKKTKSGYTVGQPLIHKTHGPGKLKSIETQNGETFLVMEIKDGGAPKKVFVPESGAKSSLRPPTQDTDSLLARLGKKSAPNNQSWNRRHREYMEMMNSGDPGEIADVLRGLNDLSADVALSFGEMKLMNSAIQRLSSEISMSKGIPISKAEALIKAALKGKK